MIAVRPWDEGDRRFVVETFLDNYRTSHAAGLISVDDWKAVMEPQISKVLARPRLKVLVACNPDELRDGRADLYGWMAFEQGHEVPYVVFAYVKSPYRRMGVASRLIKAAGINPVEPFWYACKTGMIGDLRSAIPRARWWPLPIRFPPP